MRRGLLSVSNILTGLAMAAIAATGASAADFPNPLATEPLGTSAALPEKYPTNWIFVQDLHFMSLLDGKAAIIDITAENNNLKGQIPVAQFGNLTPSTTKPEIYVGETFYSRLTRGERTDVITIWDTRTLSPKGEIVLPGGKRSQSVTIKNSLQLTNDEKWALVFNFTPGASVTVVDLEARSILGDIEIPGCSQVYPTGARGFSALCADGTVTSVVLDEKGAAVKTVSSKPFNDIDKDPMFMMPAMVGKTAWFATFLGNFKAIDLSGDVAKVAGGFSIKKPEGGDPEWRPGGWQVIASDASGLLYVLVSPHGHNGSHKDGGDAVWVVDPAKKALLRSIALKNHAISVEVSREEKPSLIASRADGFLDIYDPVTGNLVRSIGGVASDPMTMTAVR